MSKPSKEAERIDQLLADPWAVDIEELWRQAADNPDPDKRKLFNALYTYVLDKRQAEVIKRKKFCDLTCANKKETSRQRE